MTGAVAGTVSALAFAALHALLIGGIWFFLVPMLVAGAACGLCLAGTYGMVVQHPTIGGWLAYNASYVGLFAVLGVLSVVVYEPVTTITLLLAASGPPEHLFRQVLPLTVVFTVAAAAVVTLVFGRRWWHAGPVLVTTTVLVLLLGLNISVLGLVEIPASSAYVVAEVFGFVVALAAVFATVFAGFERRTLRRRPSSSSG